jgi:hypothetical protein
MQRSRLVTYVFGYGKQLFPLSALPAYMPEPLLDVVCADVLYRIQPHAVKAKLLHKPCAPSFHFFAHIGTPIVKITRSEVIEVAFLQVYPPVKVLEVRVVAASL